MRPCITFFHFSPRENILFYCIRIRRRTSRAYRRVAHDPLGYKNKFLTSPPHHNKYTKSKRTRQFPAIRCPHCAHLRRSHHPPRHFIMCPQRWCRRRGCSSSCSSSSSAIVCPKSRPPHPHHSSWSDGVMDRFFHCEKANDQERGSIEPSNPIQ